MNNFIIGSFLAMLGGVTVVSYKSYAKKMNWTCGSIFDADANWLKIIAILAMVGGFIEMFFLVEWYWALLSLAVAWLVSGLITGVLREKTQLVSILLLIASVLVYFVLGAEIVNV